MRVVIVGASGNVGTAVLRALTAEPVVTSLVGVARRVPRADGSSTVGFPHDVAHWVRVDLTGDADTVARGLDEALLGADVVVHLAWAVQPSHDRAYLRRVNVDGARAVFDAVVRQGVPHLVLGSSTGTYAPGPPDGHPVDEDWPARGVPTSSYAVDKAAVERLLDDLEAAHPSLTVTRMRPSLMFQREAGAEVARLFLGRLGTWGFRAATGSPGQALGRLLRRSASDPTTGSGETGAAAGSEPARLPVLPFPAGLRLQLVHTDDAAEAFRAAIVGRHPGAFNVAHPDVLTGPDLADLLAGGRLLTLPPRLVRSALAAAWRARLAAVDEGWLDMATADVVLDVSRARRVLRWEPAHDPRTTLLDLFDGIRDDAGLPTPPLTPR